MKSRAALLLFALILSLSLAGCLGNKSAEDDSAGNQQGSQTFSGQGTRTISVSGVSGSCFSTESMELTLKTDGTLTGLYRWSRPRWRIYNEDGQQRLKCADKFDTGKQKITGTHKPDRSVTVVWDAAQPDSDNNLTGAYDNDTMTLTGQAVVKNLWLDQTADDITDIYFDLNLE